MKTLREELEEHLKYLENECDCDCCLQTREVLTAILSRHPEEEPLAMLTAKRDYNFFAVFPPLFGTRKEWVIELDDDRCVKAIVKFTAPTYAEAEAKAREYLEGLEDKK